MNRISELSVIFLLNALWQVAVIALVAAICARLLRNAPARYRYWLWAASLVLSLALPLQSLLEIREDAPRPVIAQTSEFLPAQEDSAAKESTPAATTSLPVEESGLSLERLMHRRRKPLTAAPGLSLALMSGYALFLLYRLLMLLKAWRRARELRRSAYGLEINAQTALVAERCRKAFKLQKVPLLFSKVAVVPITVGAREPVIILPESFSVERSEETLASVVGHEMAHIARRDYALNLCYQILCVPISFHPLANFIERQLSGARELACDELVTERVLEPQAYARALVRVVAGIVAPASRAFMLGVFDANILEERIMKLTRNRKRLGTRAARLLTLNICALLGLLCIALSTFSFSLQSGSSAYAGAFALKEEASSARVEAPAEQTQFASPAPGQESATTTPAKVTQTKDSGDAEERAAAACLAEKQRDTGAIPSLIVMLGDDTPIMRMRCWDGDRWSPALDSFKQPSPGEVAALALASMGTPALEDLTRALDNGNPSVRRNAAWAIGELTNMSRDGRAMAVPSLILLLQDSDEWVRMAAARALGEIRDERGAQGLVAQLSDSQWRVRRLAAWALGEMKEESAIEPLGSVLVSDTQPEVRSLAAWALGEIQSSKAISFLKQALSDPEPDVRDKARWALSEIEDVDG